MLDSTTVFYSSMGIVACIVVGSVLTLVAKFRRIPPRPLDTRDGGGRRDPVSRVDRECEFVCSRAWDLPSDYFREFIRRAPALQQSMGLLQVVRAHSVDTLPLLQSPLHLLMAGGHPSDRALGDALWADARFKRTVAHVLHRATPEDVLETVRILNGNDYWQPVVDVLRRAVNENLVGLEPYLDEEMHLKYGARNPLRPPHPFVSQAALVDTVEDAAVQIVSPAAIA